MKFTAKLIKKLPIQKGQGKNGEWQKIELVFLTEDSYPKEICVQAFGERVDEYSKLNNNGMYEVNINIESREYNGRYFTNVSAWRIDALGDQSIQNNQPAPTPPPVDFGAENNDDLPF